MADVTQQDIYNVLAAIKDARHDNIMATDKIATDLSKQVDAIDDTLTAALHTVSRDTMDVRSQVTSLGYQVRDGFTAAAKDAEINALRTQLESQKNTQFLSDRIGAEGEKTRALVIDINDRDQNRRLIERNTELVAALDDGRFWRGRFDDAQWQGLSSRLQAFQSDLQDTRQGMVNFGTMAGVGQSSTQNTVR